jgi:hypothetical protein
MKKKTCADKCARQHAPVRELNPEHLFFVIFSINLIFNVKMIEKRQLIINSCKIYPCDYLFDFLIFLRINGLR